MVIGLSLAMMMALACSKKGGSGDDVPPAKISKPEEVLMAYYKAGKAMDPDAMWRLYSAGLRKAFTAMMHGMFEDKTSEQVKKEVGVDKATVLKAKGLALLRLVANSPMAAKTKKADANKPQPTDVKVEATGDKALVRFTQDKARCRLHAIKTKHGWLLEKAGIACRSASKRTKESANTESADRKDAKVAPKKGP